MRFFLYILRIYMTIVRVRKKEEKLGQFSIVDCKSVKKTIICLHHNYQWRDYNYIFIYKFENNAFIIQIRSIHRIYIYIHISTYIQLRKNCNWYVKIVIQTRIIVVCFCLVSLFDSNCDKYTGRRSNVGHNYIEKRFIRKTLD